jgi:hypothetical protein
MRLTARALNRTLWLRQRLAEPVAADPVGMVAHLVGLQAQEMRSPYLSLRARIRDFDPASLSDAIADRRLVRFLSLRGTVHVLTPDDALVLRPWVQPALDRISRSNELSRPARDLASADLEIAVREALSGGPLPVASLGRSLGEAFPGVPEGALRNAARERVPLVQLPPRGLWKRGGAVVYDLVDRWLGRPLGEPDPRELVRRYLRAFGPATPADMTRWSSVTGLGAVFTAMAGELVRHETEDGRVLHDLPDAPIGEPDLPLPVRLLGPYDNVWLSHADRSRIATPEALKGWMGANGAGGGAVLVDGFLAGTWRLADGRVEVDPARVFTKGERAAVAAEAAAVEAFLA